MALFDNFTNQNLQQPEGKSSDELEELKLDLSDDELIKITDDWLKIGGKGKAMLDARFQKNKKYWLGTQLGENTRINDNRIFLSVETIVPIATSNTPTPNVLPAQDTIESRQLARGWEKILMAIYKKQKVAKKLERAVRHLCIGNYAIFKYWYDAESDEIETKVIHPKDAIFDNDRDINDGFNWFGERMVKTAAELIAIFPKKKREISEEVGNKLGTEIIYTEFWTNEFVIWRFKKIVLGKAKNPNWDWIKEKKNFFDTPKMPYIITNLFDIGENIAGETSLIDQVSALQDGVDKRKNQIDRNATIVNGKVIGTGQNGLKEKDFASINWADSEEYIFLSTGELTDIQRVSGSPLPQFVENDMSHSISEIDNIMGTHSTTRGEREGRETALGRQLLRDQDRGRIDLIGRRLEEAVEQLFHGWTQLVRVWFKQKKIITILNDTNAKEFIEFDADKAEDGIEIEIIPGSLIPEDKSSRQQRALTLANAQLIAPPDLYKELGIRNPMELAENLFKWQTNPQSLFEGATGDAEGDANKQILQAKQDIQGLNAGQAVPPYEESDGNHIAVHGQFMQMPGFKKLPPDIQELHLSHAEAESAIVETGAKKKI